MKVLLSILSLFVFVIVFYIYFILNEEVQNLIKLDVSQKESESSIILKVRLINKGIIPFPFYSGLLPWENYNIFQVVGIPFVQKNINIVYHDIIKQHFTISDPFTNLKFLFPMETVEGYINLNHRFSKKDMDLLKQKNTLICWGYPFSRYGEINFHWYQGYVISQIQDSKKLNISKAIKNNYNEKCSSVLTRVEGK